jgi:hypothetical protein
MKIGKIIGGLALVAAMFAPGLACAEVNIAVGHLRCNVAPGMGVLVTSSKDLRCEYTALGGGFRERYVGVIRKFGLDLGPTYQGVLIWDVFAPAGGPMLGALTGQYLGGAASATIGAGLGANAMVSVLAPGNGGRSITLQPLSTQAQTGLNFAAGVASMTLEPAEPELAPAPVYRHHRYRHHPRWR